jgi:hypothetical protein
MAYDVVVQEYKRATSPALPESQKYWIEEELRKLERVLENHSFLLNINYGSFSSDVDQFATTINTAYGVTYNSTEFSKGVTIGTPSSRVIVNKRGVYNFQFSLQLGKSSGSLGYIYIWARVNGIDVPNSATKVAVQGSTTETVAAWNFVLGLDKNEYFELMWSADSTGCFIAHEPAAAPVPAIPSVLLSVTEVI